MSRVSGAAACIVCLSVCIDEAVDVAQSSLSSLVTPVLHASCVKSPDRAPSSSLDLACRLHTDKVTPWAYWSFIRLR